jgi:hypothetical protein
MGRKSYDSGKNDRVLSLPITVFFLLQKLIDEQTVKKFPARRIISELIRTCHCIPV